MTRYTDTLTQDMFASGDAAQHDKVASGISGVRVHYLDPANPIGTGTVGFSAQPGFCNLLAAWHPPARQYLAAR